MSKPRRPKRKINGLLLLDKPVGLSSNQALQRVRSLYQAEKAGHTGSLDPLATGMLPICLGQATKLCGYLLDSDKRYRATVKLGEKTTTGDAEGEVIARSDPAAITATALRAALAGFVGPILQVPPMYSALKRDGRPLYELAREGIEVPREARPITIHDLQLNACGDGGFQFDVLCSKGTYVRTLAEDIAAAVGQYGHLTALRREEVRPFQGMQMITLEQLEEASKQGLAALDRLLLPALTALMDWQRAVVDEARAHYLSRGQAVRVSGAPPSGLIAVTGDDGSLLCIAEVDDLGMLAPRRWLRD